MGAGPPSGSLSRVALAFMGSHAAPSGGSASDDWTKQGRTRSKARGSTRADAPADSALRHGSEDTTDHGPELGFLAILVYGMNTFIFKVNVFTDGL